MRHKDAVEQFTENGCTVYLYPDRDASNPREDHDNFGRMVCWHRRYTLTDGPKFEYNGKTHSETFADPSEFQAWWKEHGKNGVCLPLYLYDHSGISMSTSHAYPYNDIWDAGQVGYIYATREMILENWNAKRLSKKLREQAAELLRSEVSEFDNYIRGEVYGYVVEGADGEDVDSCWGFIGREYAEQEAKSRLKEAADEARQSQTDALSREAESAGDVPIDSGTPYQFQNTREIETRLSEHYSKKLNGKVSCHWDDDKQAYCISGSGLPAHPEVQAQYPNGWTMIDYLKRDKAAQVLGGVA